MGKQAQASTSTSTDVAERILAMLGKLDSRLTALETPTAPTPAKASTPAPKLTREAKAAKKVARKAKADGKLKRDANKAAGRMESARYACGSEGCKFFSYSKTPAEAHTLKAGHKVVEL
jgi:hypothetical protein